MTGSNARPRRVLKKVTITHELINGQVSGVMKQESDVGCTVEVPPGVILPRLIELTNALDGYQVECSVQNRNGTTVELKFESDFRATFKVQRPSIAGNNSLVPDEEEIPDIETNQPHIVFGKRTTF